MLNDRDFLRYQRQISLTEIGERGQQQLREATVLIIGCGGLGSAASLYLASAGVGTLVIVDHDVVDSSNMQRQVVYREGDVGQEKVVAMAAQLKGLNAECRVRTLNKKLAEGQLSLEVMMADLVLDCTDNLPTRQMINRVCFQQSTPLVSAAAIGWQGQFAVFDYSESEDAKGCYRCLYPFDELPQAKSCVESGIIGPVVGTLGNYQALAAIQKLATGQFHFQTSQLHIFDGLSLQWQRLEIAKDAQCSTCAES